MISCDCVCCLLCQALGIQKESECKFVFGATENHSLCTKYGHYFDINQEKITFVLILTPSQYLPNTIPTNQYLQIPTNTYPIPNIYQVLFQIVRQ